MKKQTTKQKQRQAILAKARHENKLKRQGKGAEYGMKVKAKTVMQRAFEQAQQTKIAGVSSQTPELTEDGKLDLS